MSESKKAKKVERIRAYFAETAMNMIKAEGIQSVSVRKVADEAGYSLGTIYNHYENLDEMLWVTRSLLIHEIADYIDRYVKETVESVDDIVAIFETYMRYYVEIPTVYAFLYFHQLEKCDKKDPALNEMPEFQERFIPLITFLTEKKEISPNKVMHVISMIMYIVHGLLTLYISGNDEMTEDMIYTELRACVYNIISD